MLKEYEWIASEKQLFGQPNTAYDFKTNNPKEAGQRLQKLQEKKGKLERNVNMRAMNMLSEAEERVNGFLLSSLQTRQYLVDCHVCGTHESPMNRTSLILIWGIENLPKAFYIF